MLTIRATLATVILDTGSSGDNIGHNDCTFLDEGEPNPRYVQCLLLALVPTRITGTEEQPREEIVEHSHIVLAVEQHANGIYYRTGLLRLRQTQWEASDPVTEVIQLG